MKLNFYIQMEVPSLLAWRGRGRVAEEGDCGVWSCGKCSQGLLFLKAHTPQL